MLRIGLNAWFCNQPQVGSGQYVRHLRRELVARSDLSCVTFQPTPAGPAQQARQEETPTPSGTGGTQTGQATDDGGEVVVPLRPWGALAKVWYEQVDLPRSARSRVDLLHYPYFASPLFKTCPTIVTIHDLIPFLFPEYSANPQLKLYNALIAQAARRADAIIAVSEQTRCDIVKHLRIPEQRIFVTYEAAGESFRPQMPETIAALKRRYGLGRYVFYIGGLNRHKNVQALLAAFAQARKNLARPCQVVIAGKAHSANPAVFPDLRTRCRALGLTWAEGYESKPVDVRFLGFVPEEDKPALYSGADLFVYPSLYEGFGFCPLEAMASGVPVVSSRAASLAEIVGDGGLLVEPTDVRGMADAIVAVLSSDDLAAGLRARGLRQAARFTWAKTAAGTVEAYRDIMHLFTVIPREMPAP